MKANLKNSLFICAAIAALIIAGCGSSIEIASKWRTQNIVIDGKNTEWEGGVYLKEANAVINVYNDANYIYVGIISPDRQLSRKVIMNGLIVWLDRTGSESKDFGIKFPIGAVNQDMEMPPQGEQENFDRPDRMENHEQMDEMFMKGLSEYEIMGHGGKVESRQQIIEKNGIEVKIGREAEKFVYELKMPMKIFGDILYAVGTDTGKVISVGFETGSVDMDKLKSRMGKGKNKERGEEQEGSVMNDNPESMGSPMGGGGGRRHGGGGMGQSFADAQKQVGFWAKVHLASAGAK